MRLRPAMPLALAVVLFAGSAFTGNQARAADPVPIRVGWVAPVENFASILLMKPALMHNQGKTYNLEPQHFASTPTMIPALAAGEIDIGSISYAAFANAIENASMEDLRRLRHALEAMDAAVGDLAAYERADVAFHMAVFSASHNALLARFAHLVADFLQLSFSIQQRALNEADNRIEDDVE